MFWWFLYRIFSWSIMSIDRSTGCLLSPTTDSFKSPSSFFPLWVFLISPRHMRHTHDCNLISRYFEIFPARIELGWPDLCTRKKIFETFETLDFFVGLVTSRWWCIKSLHWGYDPQLAQHALQTCNGDLQIAAEFLQVQALQLQNWQIKLSCLRFCGRFGHYFPWCCSHMLFKTGWSPECCASWLINVDWIFWQWWKPPDPEDMCAKFSTSVGKAGCWDEMHPKFVVVSICWGVFASNVARPAILPYSVMIPRSLPATRTARRLQQFQHGKMMWEPSGFAQFVSWRKWCATWPCVPSPSLEIKVPANQVLSSWRIMNLWSWKCGTGRDAAGESSCG